MTFQLHNSVTANTVTGLTNVMKLFQDAMYTFVPTFLRGNCTIGQSSATKTLTVTGVLYANGGVYGNVSSSTHALRLQSTLNDGIQIHQNQVYCNIYVSGGVGYPFLSNTTSTWNSTGAGNGQILLGQNNAVQISGGNATKRVLSIGDTIKFTNVPSENTFGGANSYLVYNTSSSKIGYYITSSDDRRKHNEKLIQKSSALKTINKLTCKRYQMTDTLYAADHNGVIDEPFREEAGFIAQDVAKIP